MVLGGGKGCAWIGPISGGFDSVDIRGVVGNSRAFFFQRRGSGRFDTAVRPTLSNGGPGLDWAPDRWRADEMIGYHGSPEK